MIAIIVINFGSPELTIRFVNEECVKIREEHVVIVVDNASTDETFGLISSSLPDAVVLRSTENQGYARANNQGAEYAIEHFHPELFLFSNNDIYFKDPDVVDVLISQMRNHPEVGIMGPQVLGMDGMRQSPYLDKSFAQLFLLPTWGKLLYKKATLSRMLQKGYTENAQEGACGWVQGSFFVVRAGEFLQVGGFDPATFLYAEEQILSARFALIGKMVYFYPMVTVIHDQGAISKKHFNNLDVRLMKFNSAVYYYREYRKTPLWEIILGRIMLWISIIRGK